MELSHFKDQLQTLGTDLARWPSVERDGAIDLLARSQAAQDLFARLSAEDPVAGDAALNPDNLTHKIMARLRDDV